MNELDRNIRTLIICFVLAIGVLVPLRIQEQGNLIGEQVKVLGEIDVEENVVQESPVEEDVYIVNDIVLPDVDTN